MTPTLTDMQREIQRKFGRNMLLLQQYERLMKSLVAEQGFFGAADELPKAKARQVETVSRKTLGQVVGEFTERYAPEFDR